MTTAVQPAGGGGGAVDRPSGSGLADVVDTILDKGLVIDAYVRVSLVGIELLTVDARVVVAGVDTYLRFAEAANRLDLAEKNDSKGLPDLVGDASEHGAQKKVKGAAKGALDAAGDTVRDFMGGDEEEQPREKSGRRSHREKD